MKLSEILNLKYPVIQGGMAHISNGNFAAEVSKCGALGIIGSGGMNSAELKKEIKICKSVTDKPFGVNLMLIQPDVREKIEVIIDEGVKIITTGAGNPAPYLDLLHENKIKVFPVVSTVSMAVRMEKLGVDGIIVEGSDAGGHIGDMTTMTLLPQVAQVVSIPLIAAGGIGSGRQILAAKILGAWGVQMGTRFLASEECPIHDTYKDKLVSLKSSNITSMGRISGLPSRVLKSPMVRNYIKNEKEGKSGKELEILTLGALREAVYNGNWEKGIFMAGFTIGQINEIRPIRDILKSLELEYFEELEKIRNED